MPENTALQILLSSKDFGLERKVETEIIPEFEDIFSRFQTICNQAKGKTEGVTDAQILGVIENIKEIITKQSNKPSQLKTVEDGLILMERYVKQLEQLTPEQQANALLATTFNGGNCGAAVVRELTAYTTTTATEPKGMEGTLEGLIHATLHNAQKEAFYKTMLEMSSLEWSTTGIDVHETTAWQQFILSQSNQNATLAYSDPLAQKLSKTQKEFFLKRFHEKTLAAFTERINEAIRENFKLNFELRIRNHTDDLPQFFTTYFNEDFSALKDDKALDFIKLSGHPIQTTELSEKCAFLEKCYRGEAINTETLPLLEKEVITEGLLIALRRKHNETFKSLINALDIVKIKDPLTDNSLLHLAAVIGNDEATAELLKHSSTFQIIQARNLQGLTAFLLAAQNGHGNVCEEILKINSEAINEKDDNGNTALLLAAARGHWNVCEKILEKNPKAINEKDNYGNTAFPTAAFNGHWNICEKILEINKGAINEKNNTGKTAFLQAAQKGHGNIFEKILKINKEAINEKDIDGNTAFLAAAYSGHWNICEKILKKNPKAINEKNNTGYTAFLMAAYNGHWNICEKILKINKEAINEKNNTGKTAFLLAAQKGHGNIFEKILEINKGAINEKDIDGNTAFLLAAQEGKLDICKKLLEKGASIEDCLKHIQKTPCLPSQFYSPYSTEITTLILNKEKELKKLQKQKEGAIRADKMKTPINQQRKSTQPKKAQNSLGAQLDTTPTLPKKSKTPVAY